MSLHLTAARWGNVLVALADPERAHDWLLTTTQKRVQEALAELGVYPTAAQTQVLDLAQGHTLQVLGHEFRLLGDRRVGSRVQYNRMGAGPVYEGDDEPVLPSLYTDWMLAALRFLLRGRMDPARSSGAGRRAKKKATVPPSPETETNVRGAPAASAGIRAAAPTTEASASDVPFPRLLDRVRNLRMFLSYSLPVPSWDQVVLMVRATCKKWPWLPPVLAAAALVGCVLLRGGSVRGMVQHEGRPVEQGWVVFEPMEPSSERGASRLTARVENGKYDLSGLDAGTYSAVVLVPDMKTRPRIQVDVGYLWTTQNFDLGALVVPK
jgi:hypothetical protein